MLRSLFVSTPLFFLLSLLGKKEGFVMLFSKLLVIHGERLITR